MSEQDDLLKDLENRATHKSNKKAEDYEVGDIEAFLKEQEGDEYVPPEPEEIPQTTKVSPKETKKEPVILDPPKGELDKEDPRAVRKKSTTVAKPVERGHSTGLVILTLIFKFIVFILPIIITAWFVGSWIGSWVAPGWLLAVVSILIALIPGLVLYLFVRKGRAIWWMAALSAVLTVALGGIWPNISGQSIVRHGHWPLTAITNPLGISPDNLATRGLNSLDLKIANLLKADTSAIVPTALGSGDPLIPGPTSANAQPTDSQPTQPAPPNPNPNEQPTPAQNN